MNGEFQQPAKCREMTRRGQNVVDFASQCGAVKEPKPKEFGLRNSAGN